MKFHVYKLHLLQISEATVGIFSFSFIFILFDRKRAACEEQSRHGVSITGQDIMGLWRNGRIFISTSSGAFAGDN